jgi:hypothetical protein
MALEFKYKLFNLRLRCAQTYVSSSSEGMGDLNFMIDNKGRIIVNLGYAIIQCKKLFL